MKKFLAAILSVLCLACLCLALTACKGPKYYKLTYGAINGVTLDFGEIQSGAQVKKDYEVKFTCSVDENRVTGEPTVLVNGDDVYPDLEGVYSFKMSKDTDVTVSGVYAINTFDVTFDKEQWRIKYLDAETGKELSTLEDVTSGTRVSFRLDVSVYYDRNAKFDVLANTTVVSAENGVYSFTVSRKTTVKVSGLKTEESFLTRDNGGKGTVKDPYLIERPIDLYVMADYVNDSFYNGKYSLANYKLNADIDMEGEQAFIIGDGTTNISMFCGNFNGNHHKIYNYYVSDTIIEQDQFSTVFMPYIGLFGYACGTIYGPAEIYDLTLENFTINVNAAKYDSNFYAGGLAGLAMGVNISNCSVSGEITADADDVYYGYMGGIAGFMQSAYNSESQRVSSSIVGCSTDVKLEGQSGYMHSAGGIVGYLNTFEQNTSSYIVNSYSAGSVAGAMNAGGIAGYANAYSSVKNCYSLGTVDAYNEISPTLGFEQYAYANAGGIVGYAEHDSVISGCFSLSDARASASGSKYERAGKICGGLEAGGGDYVEAASALVLNCTSTASNITESYLTGTLGWVASEWTFGNGYPKYNGLSGNKTAAVAVKHVAANGSVTNGATVNLSASNYLPVNEWYRTDLDEFATNGTLRSYGYYFDEALTQKVPSGYVLSGAETLYCGFADYNEVSGVYYLQTAVRGSGAYIELLPDGTLIYRSGALNLTTSYIYDGNQITLFDTPALTEQSSDGSYYTCGIGVLDGGVLTITNNLTYKESSPLKAVKKIEGFLYGAYYSASDTECVFNTDGTGTLNGAPMTYTVNGSTVKINDTTTGTLGNRTVTIGGTAYTAYDPFRGTWEKSATTHEEFTFDGKNKWSYIYYGLVDGEKKEIATASGTYAYNGSDDTLTLTVTQNKDSGLSNGTIIGFDMNGCLLVTRTDYTQPYYKPLSLTGTWRYFYKEEAIEITFNGVGNRGYGTALVSYETLPDDLEATYAVETVNGNDYIYIFLEDMVLGVLHFDASDLTLKGLIYSYKEGAMLEDYIVYDEYLYAETGEMVVLNTYKGIVSFCLYDEFGGQWITDYEGWGVIEFNGYGSYKRTSIMIKEQRNKILTLPVSGTVKINGKTGTYELNEATMQGTLHFEDADHDISYNAAEDTVSIGTSGKLYRPDRLMGIRLKDNNGVIYTFDGGSDIPAGGTVTASDGNGYKYKISGTGNSTVITVTGLGTITVSGNNYVLGGSNILTVVNGFTGSWYVGTTLQTLVIGEISPLNKAQGSYLGVSKTFDYNSAEDYLTFEHNNHTYYIFAKIAVNSGVGYELIISTAENEMYGETVHCLSTGEQTDAFRGTYTAENGDTLVFDGLSVCAYGDGTLIITRDGGTEIYSYTVNSFGMVQFVEGVDDDGNTIRVVITEAAAGTEGAFTGEGKTLVLLTPDRLYLRAAVDLFKKVYTFDGIDTVVCGDEQYKYVIDERDELDLVYRLTLTDGAGKTHKAEVGFGSTSYTFRFVDELTDIAVRSGDWTYTFVSAGVISASNATWEQNTEALICTYSIVSYDEQAKKYTLTVSIPDGESAKLYDAVLDCSNEAAYKIQLTEKTA